MNKLFLKIKNKLKLLSLGLLFLLQTACGSSYYEKTFPLAFDPNKQVQHFEFELDVKRNQDKDKYHTIFLLMYFDKNSNGIDEFKNKGEIKYTNNPNTSLIFNKMKIKSTIKDNLGNIIAEYENYPKLAGSKEYLRFDIPLIVEAMKKGKYTLLLSITQLEPFDYSKVQKMEIYFTRPSFK